MALYRCGGGLNLDLMNPDLTWQANATKTSNTITVTQKPRYIVLDIWSAYGSSYGGMLGIIDVENNTAKRMGYWNSAKREWTNWDNWTSYITSITSSQVVYNASAWDNNNSRAAILFYY